jgi:hypothetical protein
MTEINPKNVKISQKIFGSNANICCANFLKDEDTKKCFKLFGVDKFDIIIGNPPYNEGSTGKSGTKFLDEEFIKRSIELLQENSGYLLFITKTGWRSVNSNVYDIIIDKQIDYIKTYDFNTNPFKENVLVNYFLLKNKPTEHETIFEFSNETTSGKIKKGMNIYFLYAPFLNYLNTLTQKYGNLSDITRSKKQDGSEYLLIRHSTPEVLVEKTVSPGDKYYIITNPNSLMKYFFKSDIYKQLREIGRFTGFTTSKDIFFDIPNFNNIKNPAEKEEVKQKLIKYNTQKSQGFKIKNFITKKHREGKKKDKASRTITKFIKNKRKTKKQENKKGGKNKTLKNKSLFKIW